VDRLRIHPLRISARGAATPRARGSGERLFVEVSVEADEEEVSAADRRRTQLSGRSEENAEQLLVARVSAELGDPLALGDPDAGGLAGDLQGPFTVEADLVGDGGLGDRRTVVRKKLLRSLAGRSTLAVVVPVDGLHACVPPWL
jgi:hypothetical protein